MSVLKSVRIPEEIYDYICSYRGASFNQKFTNIISDARDSEESRMKRLKYLDTRIQTREAVLDEFSKDIIALRRKFSSL